MAARPGGRSLVLGGIRVAQRQRSFGERSRLEAVYLGRQGTGAGWLRLAARSVGLADQVGVRAVLTNAVPYADAEQHRLADVLYAARFAATHPPPAPG